MDDISFFQIAGHCAYLLIFSSFLVKRMLMLRVLAIFASTLSIVYNFKIQSNPLWVPIQWNCLFIAVNIYHIVRLFMQKRPVVLSEEQDTVYKSSFLSMPLNDFKSFYELGVTKTFEASDTLITQDQEIPALYYIVEGKASIEIDSKVVNTLSSHKFVGEMSFLTKSRTTATVKTERSSQIHCWERKTLEAYFKKNPEMLAKVHSAIGAQLIGHIIFKAKQGSKDCTAA